MQFLVGSEQMEDPFVVPKRLSSFRRMNGSDLSAASVQRMVALVKHEVNEQDMFMLHELQPSSAPTTGEPLIAIEDESGVTTTYTTVAERFEVILRRSGRHHKKSAVSYYHLSWS